MSPPRTPLPLAPTHHGLSSAPLGPARPRSRLKRRGGASPARPGPGPGPAAPPGAAPSAGGPDGTGRGEGGPRCPPAGCGGGVRLRFNPSCFVLGGFNPKRAGCVPPTARRARGRAAGAKSGLGAMRGAGGEGAGVLPGSCPGPGPAARLQNRAEQPAPGVAASQAQRLGVQAETPQSIGHGWCSAWR